MLAEPLERRSLFAAITGLYLVDVGTGTAAPLADGASVTLPAAGIAVEARVDGSTSSVRFAVDGASVNENKAPYVTGGDGDDRRPGTTTTRRRFCGTAS